MATPKVWTATDLDMGVMRLAMVGSDLSVIQGYTFVDDQGATIEELPQRSLQITTPFSSLPENIRQALIALNNYMYQAALNREEMND